MLVCALVTLAAISQVAASAFSYRVKANENACFYTNADKANEKIAFYFSVQAGGDFDIDYYAIGPHGHTILNGQKEKQGDFVFSATVPGEYKFCFNNDMSTVTDKIVDFEIQVENEPRSAELPQRAGTGAEQTTAIEESVLKLSSQVSQMSRTQKYFRTRENRNMSTVQSTEYRIFWFALLESCFMVTISGLQVFIVRTFFSRRSHTKV
ncbi:Erp2,4 [Taphrina deformans PYCC 5710]|uniref:Erp2,4 n=1 Tax=Taphrina deformans (strain PYCC 5710 / ATCC 11124 / CBS 356.35 / IMI 108563 / JCM 9778 / NBRC 8474) TaxID=1097556 RepID=R4XFC8_TAPDE|nr:Erp2,4 [Taphrina deformans PYCC 5710]|eukprot:CCG83151.1 Erp2,4 [Taphrina deformans PYCC 5710]